MYQKKNHHRCFEDAATMFISETLITFYSYVVVTNVKLPKQVLIKSLENNNNITIFQMIQYS